MYVDTCCIFSIFCFVLFRSHFESLFSTPLSLCCHSHIKAKTPLLSCYRSVCASSYKQGKKMLNKYWSHAHTHTQHSHMNLNSRDSLASKYKWKSKQKQAHMSNDKRVREKKSPTLKWFWCARICCRQNKSIYSRFISISQNDRKLNVCSNFFSFILSLNVAQRYCHFGCQCRTCLVLDVDPGIYFLCM